MTYEELKRAWIGSLHHSGLGVFGPEAVRERLDLQQLDRTAESIVELRTPQIEPFLMTATVSWRWASVHSARTATTEEDLMLELVGPTNPRARTERPWLRVDASIRAALPHAGSLPFPALELWTAWSQTVGRQLENIGEVRKPRSSSASVPQILKWDGLPSAQVRTGADGVLRVEAIEIRGWQGIPIPRRWSDTRRKPDPHPGPVIDQLFARLEASLALWTRAVLDLLPPRPITASSPTLSPKSVSSISSTLKQTTTSSASRRLP